MPGKKQTFRRLSQFSTKKKGEGKPLDRRLPAGRWKGEGRGGKGKKVLLQSEEGKEGIKLPKCRRVLGIERESQGVSRDPSFPPYTGEKGEGKETVPAPFRYRPARSHLKKREKEEKAALLSLLPLSRRKEGGGSKISASHLQASWENGKKAPEGADLLPSLLPRKKRESLSKHVDRRTCPKGKGGTSPSEGEGRGGGL